MQYKKAISTSELVSWIPHRPPMVWIDEVLSYGPEGGECVLILKDDGHYMTNGKLRASSLVEFIAQTHAFVEVCNIVKADAQAAPLTEAFLVSITDAIFEDLDQYPEILSDKKLFIQTGPARKLGAITVFSGSVRTSANNQICTANIKVYTK